jgi:hypothetical protein
LNREPSCSVFPYEPSIVEVAPEISEDTMTGNITYVRVLAALAVLVSAGAHLKLWIDGFRDLHVVGPAFMLNAVGGIVIAVLLMLWRHWIPAFLALGFGASTLGGFIIASTVGLYGVHEHWVGGYVWASAISESIAIVTGAVLLLRDNPLRSGRQLEHGSTVSGADLH